VVGGLSTGERCELFVEASHATFGLGFAFLAGVDRVRSARNVEGYVRIGLAVAVLEGLICFDRGTDQPESIGRYVVKKDRAVVGMDTGFYVEFL
jgi:hypothetical protein